MKITRKTVKIVKEFHEIEKGETFLIGDTPYMKVDTDDFEIECDRCDAMIEVEDFAVNLITGELITIYRFNAYELCECEVIVDR